VGGNNIARSDDKAYNMTAVDVTTLSNATLLQPLQSMLGRAIFRDFGPGWSNGHVDVNID